ASRRHRMNTTTSTLPRSVPSSNAGAGAWLLRADGLFLLVVGTLASIQEARGHFAGSGPLAHLWQSPYTIGGFEAHGLAAILGVLLIAHAGALRPLRWHLCAAAIHLLLGGANLLFWISFVALDMLAVGIATTTLHAVFVVANLLAVVALRRRA